jgi:hypothetical protein
MAMTAGEDERLELVDDAIHLVVRRARAGVHGTSVTAGTSARLTEKRGWTRTFTARSIRRPQPVRPATIERETGRERAGGGGLVRRFFGETRAHGGFERSVGPEMDLRRGDGLELTCIGQGGDHIFVRGRVANP